MRVKASPVAAKSATGGAFMYFHTLSRQIDRIQLLLFRILYRISGTAAKRR